jgi:hypothetical protein
MSLIYNKRTGKLGPIGEVAYKDKYGHPSSEVGPAPTTEKAAKTETETNGTTAQRLRRAMDYQRQILRSVPVGKKTTLG